MTEKKRKKIVVIGGGKGTAAVLFALKSYPVELCAVVSMADDGGSTGILRQELAVHPPGSVRPALVALARSKVMARFFEYRFGAGGLKGHTIGNIIIAGFEKLYGDFESAVFKAGKLLDIQGEVIPSTLDCITLFAEFENGIIIRRETEIDIPKEKNRPPIKRVWLEPKGRINPKARAAVLHADMIVIGPGDLYTSIIPNFLVSGMREALKKSKAKKVFVVNAVNKYGETNGFAAGDFIRVIESYLGKKVIDVAAVNKKIISPECVHPENLPKSPASFFADLLNGKNPGRYDPKILAQLLIFLLKSSKITA